MDLSDVGIVGALDIMEYLVGIVLDRTGDSISGVFPKEDLGCCLTGWKFLR